MGKRKDGLLAQKDVEITALQQKIHAYAIHTTALQTRLLSTLDLLDSLQSRLTNQDLLKERLKKAEEERDDMREGVLELVRRVEETNGDFTAWPHARIRIPSLADPLPSKLNISCPDVDPTPIISTLLAERTSLRHQIRVLEAQLARRDHELAQCVIGHVAPNYSESVGKEESAVEVDEDSAARILEAKNRVLEAEVGRLGLMVEDAKRRKKQLDAKTSALARPQPPTQLEPEPLTHPDESPTRPEPEPPRKQLEVNQAPARTPNKPSVPLTQPKSPPNQIDLLTEEIAALSLQIDDFKREREKLLDVIGREGFQDRDNAKVPPSEHLSTEAVDDSMMSVTFEPQRISSPRTEPLRGKDTEAKPGRPPTRQYHSDPTPSSPPTPVREYHSGSVYDSPTPPPRKLQAARQYHSDPSAADYDSSPRKSLAGSDASPSPSISHTNAIPLNEDEDDDPVLTASYRARERALVEENKRLRALLQERERERLPQSFSAAPASPAHSPQGSLASVSPVPPSSVRRSPSFTLPPRRSSSSLRRNLTPSQSPAVAGQDSSVPPRSPILEPVLPSVSVSTVPALPSRPSSPSLEAPLPPEPSSPIPSNSTLPPSSFVPETSLLDDGGEASMELATPLLPSIVSLPSFGVEWDDVTEQGEGWDGDEEETFRFVGDEAQS